MSSNSLVRPDEGEHSSSVQLKTYESSPSSCKYKGVRKRKWGKWVSEIRLPNSRERIWLGSYDCPVKAARAFDAAQFCLRGKSANFNFPDNPPQIPGAPSMTPAEIQSAAARFANLAATNDIDNDMNRDEEQGIECDNQIEYIVTDTPTISEGTVPKIDDSEMIEAATSVHEQLSLSSTFESGNYVSEFGYFTGYDYMAGDYNTTIQSDDNNYGDDIYDTSIYQDSCLWNF